MKEFCHKQLSRLVGKNGSIPIGSKYLHELIEFSIEPDQINKQEIAEHLLESLSVPFEWLIEHTIRAKKMAIQSIKRANKGKKEGKEGWLQHLGWAFHYIADWATPHHSPSSKSNQILPMAGLGALFGGILGGLSEASKMDKEKFFKGITKGSLFGAGVMGAAGAVDLVINHNRFESKCDKRWKTLDFNKISSQFKSVRIPVKSSQTWETQLEKFKVLMDDLRKSAERLPSDWINTCSDDEFIQYMLQIAKVMDFAAQMVIG
jgi:hypothetical protein